MYVCKISKSFLVFFFLYKILVQKQSGAKDPQDLSSLSDQKLNKYLAKAGFTFMDYFLANQQMQNLLNISPDDFDYDLIIVDLFYTEALLALGYYSTCPIVGVLNTDFANYMQQVQEIMVPAACLPYNLENYDQNLGYWQRLSNIELCLARRNSFIYDHYANQEKIIKKYFKQPSGKTVEVFLNKFVNNACTYVSIVSFRFYTVYSGTSIEFSFVVGQ